MTRHLTHMAVFACLVLAVVAGAQTTSETGLRPPDATLIARRQLGVLVYTKLTMQLERVPARQAFDMLQQRLAIPMVGRYQDDPTGHGIDPATLITLDMTDVTALSLLEEMLAQCAAAGAPCTWQLRTGFVEFGTKRRLSVPAACETRLHYIADLAISTTTTEDRKRREEMALGVVERIVETVEPGSWDWGQPLEEPDDIPIPAGSVPATPPDLKVRRGTPPQEAPEIPPPDDADADATPEPAPDTEARPRRYVAPRRIAIIRYWRDFLIVHAPDYIHRQISGYPEPIRPEPMP
jgi:hypothetical protein